VSCAYAAGDADLPHTALGAARRVVVPQRQQQGAAMLQAARKHCMDVMIVDEIATAEVNAGAVSHVLVSSSITSYQAPSYEM
jgi:stage III sporulation protein SpoIIIAA